MRTISGRDFKMLPYAGWQRFAHGFPDNDLHAAADSIELIALQFGMTGKISAMIAVVCGVLFLMQTFYLMRTCSKKAAMSIMFASFLYLPIVQIALVLDKI